MNKNKNKKKSPPLVDGHDGGVEEDTLRSNEPRGGAYGGDSSGGGSTGRFIDESGVPIDNRNHRETPRRGPSIIENRRVVPPRDDSLNGAYGRLDVTIEETSGQRNTVVGELTGGEERYRIIDNISLMETDSDAERMNENSASRNLTNSVAVDQTESCVGGRKRGRSSPDSPVESRLTPVQRRIIRDGTSDLHLCSSSTLGENVLGWLDEMEQARRSSRSLQGAVSGTLKVKIRLVKDGVEELVRRACSAVEADLQRRKLTDASRELNELRKRNFQLTTEHEELKRELENSRNYAVDRATGFHTEPSSSRAADINLANLSEIGRARERRVEDTNRLRSEGNLSGSDINDRGIATGGYQSTTIEFIEQLVDKISSEVKRFFITNRRRDEARNDGGRLHGGSFTGPTNDSSFVNARGARNMNRSMNHEDGGGQLVGQGARRRGGLPSGVGSQNVTDTPRRVNSTNKEYSARQISVISITCEENGPSYASILRRARNEIDMNELGIESTRIRRAMSGGILIEISNDEDGRKAERLLRRLREVMRDGRVRVARPRRLESVRVSGLDDSIVESEIGAALTNALRCNKNEFKLGPIRMARNGMGTTVITCESALADKLKKANNLRIGWSAVTVESLPARPVRCYRCMAVGHTSYRCSSKTDRSGACFNCGTMGHRAERCEELPTCPVCLERGLPYYHRAGEAGCPPCPPGPFKDSRNSREEATTLQGDTAAAGDKEMDDDADNEEAANRGSDNRKPNKEESLRPDWM